MTNIRIKLNGEVRKDAGESQWHFAVVSKEDADEIRKELSPSKRSAGSLSVVASIAKTTWKTSLLTEKETGGYLLPIKADVREKENIKEGDVVSATLQLEG